MPVDSTHPDYGTHLSLWRKSRIAVLGEDAVKAAGIEFLPQLSGQDSHEYEAYRSRASYFNASGRTVAGITGAVFRKDPEIAYPDPDFLDSVGKGGQPFVTFAKKTFSEVLTLGRYGVLLDSDTDADISAHPYFVGYVAENIINWDFAVINNREQPTMVVLREVLFVRDPTDPFQWIEETQYRVLHLGNSIPVFDEAGKMVFEQGTSPVYFVVIWTENKDTSSKVKDKFIISNVIVPTIRGRRLDYIPFVFFGPTDLSVVPEKPPIIDIVNVNLSHYRNSADLEHGRHFTALPTPWAAGFDVKPGEKLHIGSSTAWISSEANASAGFLEFTGSGLGALSEALTQKEGQMAILGARLLEEPKRSVEAADTHKLRRSGEESITASMSITVSRGFQILLEWAAAWEGKSDADVQAQLNTDFVALEIAPQMIQALLLLLTQGKISYSTFFYNLRKGEVIPEGRTMEDEVDLIVTQGPMLQEIVSTVAEIDNVDAEDAAVEEARRAEEEAAAAAAAAE